MMSKKLLLTGCCGVAFFLSLSCGKIQDVAADLLISDEQEVQLGTQYKSQIEADKTDYPMYTAKADYNQNLTKYIDSIGQNIVSNQDDRTGIDFTFKVIDNDSVINAFAVPGGFVYVYTGLLKSARNEAEIAGVLAHEVAHVTNRHGAKQMVNEYGMDLLLDVLVGDSTAFRQVINISTGLAFLKYGRDNEFESDRCAVEYLINAGYNPSGMKTFLETLPSDTTSPKIAILLSTHPATQDRVARVGTIIDGKSSDIRNRSNPPIKYSP